MQPSQSKRGSLKVSLLQVNAAEKSRLARSQLSAARARHDKLTEAHRSVEALQAALEAGQLQVHVIDVIETLDLSDITAAHTCKWKMSARNPVGPLSLCHCAG